ncbi:MAG: hypothetical protein LBM23_00670 [Propionibacteriaceae bacterium]|nr:hypothetical protein [Propionibacteriaceae bacterium]
MLLSNGVVCGGISSLLSLSLSLSLNYGGRGLSGVPARNQVKEPHPRRELRLPTGRVKQNSILALVVRRDDDDIERPMLPPRVQRRTGSRTDIRIDNRSCVRMLSKCEENVLTKSKPKGSGR